jgi:hypothetical protein
VPNTFFVKLGKGEYFRSGIPYLRIYGDAFYGSCWLVLAVIVWALMDRSSLALYRRERRWVATALIGLFGYVAYAGGDHFEFRLLAPTIPLVALLLTFTVADVTRWCARHAPQGERAAGVLGAIVLGLLLAHMLHSSVTQRYAEALFAELHIPSAAGFARQNYAEQWRPAGEWLLRFAQRDERLSVPAAGVIPWLSRLCTLDTHGLSDASIAHRMITHRGVLAHEVSATEEDIRVFHPTYHLDDLTLADSLATVPARVRGDPGRIVVELPTHRWMNFGTTEDPDALRRRLRERGAIVAAGPSEDVPSAAASNAMNQGAFDRWCSDVASATERRRRALGTLKPGT